MSKEIPVFYNPSSNEHRPQFEVFNCEKRPHPDIYTRTDQIIESLQTSKIADIQISTVNNSLPFVNRVHDLEYINFLKETADLAEKICIRDNNPDAAIYPSVHPYNEISKASNAISRRGLYIFDTYTPIMKETHRVALDSAGVAVAGAILLNGGEKLVYALSRPSGHHAEKAMAGGMCYLNNVAIAAQYLKDQGANKIAIFDIDVHHGNGTQDIFYDRPDILVVNINADPKYKFPHFTGYSDEYGKDKGVGFNFNFPLPVGTDVELYNETTKKALKIINNFQPDFLLVSAGFDTHKSDPVGAFNLNTLYYKKLGLQIRNLEIPTLVVQEGGYATKVLGENVVSFLEGLSDR
ncbi:MAG: histone deacetylase family protein [Candidatus Shapirobacteria bacterium]|nr:histone deacetylase family protein [Candidatus Shapirobacteria bacterium]